MKLHIGPPPENTAFQPLEDGWTLLKEPSFFVLVIVAGVIGIVTLIPTLAAWQAISVDATAATPLTSNHPNAAFLIGFAAVVVIHEFVHAVGYPRFGFNGETVIAFWPSKGACYALFSGAMNRERWLLVYLLPLLVLSVVPVALCTILGVIIAELKFVSVLNALFCGGDLFCVGLIMWQVPRKAVMRNQGWTTFWKECNISREPL